jgi:osmotically-inducible protein OsmY
MQHNRGALVTGMVLGAGLMYLMDPDRGRRRRALARGKMTRAARKSSDALGATGRDLAHRTSGLAAKAKQAFTSEEVDDNVLVERVRAQLGRHVSHPRALDVHASNGAVILRGPILASEVSGLIAAVETIRGVHSVTSELQSHESAENIPSLQGGTAPPSAWGNLLPTRWSPTTRLLTGTAATLAALAAARNASAWQSMHQEDLTISRETQDALFRH